MHVKVYSLGRFPIDLKLLRGMKSGISKQRNQGRLARSARVSLAHFDRGDLQKMLVISQHSSIMNIYSPVPLIHWLKARVHRQRRESCSSRLKTKKVG